MCSRLHAEDYQGSPVVLTAKLILPRLEQYVATARGFVEVTLRLVGVTASSIAELRLAVGEACANAVQHAQGSTAFEVAIKVDATSCTVTVSDNGVGFDASTLRPEMPGPHAPRGRGIPLMNASVDAVDVHSGPDYGTIVKLTKTVQLEATSVLRAADTNASGSPSN